MNLIRRPAAPIPSRADADVAHLYAREQARKR
jgi:hypothetical protein